MTNIMTCILIAFVAAFCVALPVSLALCWKKRTGGTFRPVAAGVVSTLLYQLLSALCNYTLLLIGPYDSEASIKALYFLNELVPCLALLAGCLTGCKLIAKHSLTLHDGMGYAVGAGGWLVAEQGVRNSLQAITGTLADKPINGFLSLLQNDTILNDLTPMRTVGAILHFTAIFALYAGLAALIWYGLKQAGRWYVVLIAGVICFLVIRLLHASSISIEGSAVLRQVLIYGAVAIAVCLLYRYEYRRQPQGSEA